jgi:hypothetical protein
MDDKLVCQTVGVALTEEYIQDALKNRGIQDGNYHNLSALHFTLTFILSLKHKNAGNSSSYQTFPYLCPD